MNPDCRSQGTEGEPRCPGQSWDQHPKQAHSCKTQLGGSKTSSAAIMTHSCKTITSAVIPTTAKPYLGEPRLLSNEAHSCTTMVGMNQAAQSLRVQAFSWAPFGPDLGQRGLCGRKKEDKFKHWDCTVRQIKLSKTNSESYDKLQ